METLTTDEQIQLAKRNVYALINKRCKNYSLLFEIKITNIELKTDDKLLRLNKPIQWIMAKSLSFLASNEFQQKLKKIFNHAR